MFKPSELQVGDIFTCESWNGAHYEFLGPYPGRPHTWKIRSLDHGRIMPWTSNAPVVLVKRSLHHESIKEPKVHESKELKVSPGYSGVQDSNAVGSLKARIKVAEKELKGFRRRLKEQQKAEKAQKRQQKAQRARHELALKALERVANSKDSASAVEAAKQLLHT